jgi:hypothetical protein
LKLQLQR